MCPAGLSLIPMEGGLDVSELIFEFVVAEFAGWVIVVRGAGRFQIGNSTAKNMRKGGLGRVVFYNRYAKCGVTKSVDSGAHKGWAGHGFAVYIAKARYPLSSVLGEILSDGRQDLELGLALAFL